MELKNVSLFSKHVINCNKILISFTRRGNIERGLNPFFFFQVSLWASCDCGREKNSDLSAPKHRACSVNFARPSGLPWRIIRYDRSLLKSVPIKGSVREARAVSEGSHSGAGPGQNDPAIGAAYFRGQAISDLEALRAERGAGRGGINKPALSRTTNQTDTSHRRPL